MSQGEAETPHTRGLPLASGATAREGLVVPQSAIDGLRNERDALIRRLQQAQTLIAQGHTTVEALSAANADLAVAFDAAQCRLADLETESAIYNAELQRIEAERAVELDRQAAELGSERRLRATAEEHIDALRMTHGRELAEWEQAAVQREAELVEARDQLARRLEEEQSHSIVAQQQLDAANAQLCAAQAKALDTARDLGHLQDERRAWREEIERERRVYETAAQQREAESQQQIHALRQTFERDLAERDSQLAAQRHELEEAHAQLAVAQESLAALRATADADAQRRTDDAARLRSELDVREGHLAGAARERDELTAQIDTQQATVVALREQLMVLETTARTQQAQLEQAQRDGLSIREERQGEIQQWEAAAQESAGVIQVLRQTLSERDATCTQLQHQLDEVVAAHEQRADDVERVHREYAEAVAAFEEDRGSLRAELLAQQAASAKLASEKARLHEALAESQVQEGELAAEVARLQSERTSLLERQSSAAALPEMERERSELRLQVEKLSAVLRQIGQEREEQRASALQAQQASSARIDELSAERHTLILRMTELETLRSQLENECERLRRDHTASDELRRYKAEVARLQAKWEETEGQRSDAAQDHSAAVARYMVELNQRSEALHARDLETQRLNEELTLTRQACEDAVAQLNSERQERAELQDQLAELRKAAANGPARTAGTPNLRLQGSPAATAPAPTAVAAPVNPGAGAKPSTARVGQPPLARPNGQMAGRAFLAHLTNSPLTVVHLEESKDLRDSVHRVVAQIPEMRYGNTSEAHERAKGPALLAVNLLNRAHDPMAAITACIKASSGRQNIFAYCADANFGFTFGEVTFLIHPMDADSCVAWLMEACGAVQRLLVASNDIEMTSGLRTALTRIRCSTSVALDLRQVTDLMPMIQPEALLVDLSLPRAEGLRLISRLRADPKTQSLPIGVLLPDAQKLAEFRQHALRAAREGSIGTDKLAASLGAQLGLPVPTTQAPAAGSTHIAHSG